MKSIKEKLYQHCLLFANNRLSRIEKRIETLQESLNSETKSTAGDKHETGRAMVQLEREKSGVQLAEAQKLKQIISKIDLSSTSKFVCLGSVVYTTNGNYFVCISADKVNILDEYYFAIAANTPIGKILLGKKTGDQFTFNTKKYVIDKIL